MAQMGFPDDKFMSTVKVGPKGQIVIPAEVREMFGIQPGDILLLLADMEHGIALPKREDLQTILRGISEYVGFGGDGK